MRTIWTIMRKELKRIFQDKRLVLSLFLPGILVFCLYTFMGKAMNSITPEEETYTVQIAHCPEEFNTSYLSTLSNYDLHFIDKSQIEDAKTNILNEELDCLVVFPMNFQDSLSNQTKIDIQTYYNPGANSSTTANATMTSLLSSYHGELMKVIFGTDAVFTINLAGDNQIFEESKVMANLMASLVPFLLVVFLFSAAMSLVPESISGEKERHTIATLLVTPVNRSNIALGKIFSLSILTTISAISSGVGTIFSMPALMGGGGVSYSFGTYLALIAILISTVLVITGILALISAYAKSIKEASTLCVPVMIVTMMIGISSFAITTELNLGFYFIPIFNSVMSISNSMRLEPNYAALAITIISNFFYLIALVFILSKMFKSEKIMFNS